MTSRIEGEDPWLKPWDCNHCGNIANPPVAPMICPRCKLKRFVEYKASDLAFLWKEGSPIRKMMSLDKEVVATHARIGHFLRRHCGPHCPKSAGCPQRVVNLSECHNQYLKGLWTKENSRVIALPPPQYNQTKEKAAPATYVASSSTGWLSQYMHEANYREPHNGSGS